ncbi:restriction endonuclease subunit S [Photobacterium sagamiensis]|uniref:restriction endonuclease subunit S n=1 Tax=Photobacterium sagamiensis TaxID=2910241 RepID=UPI003D1480D1
MKNNSVLAQKLIGRIPNDWSYIHFKDIYQNPIRDFGSFSSTKLITFLDDGTSFIKSEMIKEGLIDWSSTQYISKDVHKLLKKSYVDKDTILFSKIGSALGKAVVYRGERGICNSNAAVAKIELNDKVADNFYYCYLLNNPLAKKQFLRLIISLLPRINLGDISSLILPLPPLPEQRKIAKTLSTWDKAIATTEKLIDASKQQKKALMQQLLTGNKRLVNPDTGKAFEGEWEEIKLGDVCSKITDGAHHSPKSVDIGYPMYSVKDMSPRGFTENSARHISQSDFDSLVKQNCKPDINDILIAKDGSILKYCFVVKNEIEGVILSSIALLRPKLNKVVPDFIAQYFSQEYIKVFVGKVLTSGSGVPRIILKDFKGIHLKIPPVNEQQKIASVLTAADNEIEVLAAKLSHLKQEKKALMQQLLTGKRRVLVEETVAA